MPSRRSRSRYPDGKALGTAACVSPAWAAGTGSPFVAHLQPAETLRVQLVDADLLERVHDDVACDAADRGRPPSSPRRRAGRRRAPGRRRDRERRAAPRAGAPGERNVSPMIEDVGHRRDPIARAPLAIQGSSRARGRSLSVGSGSWTISQHSASAWRRSQTSAAPQACSAGSSASRCRRSEPSRAPSRSRPSAASSTTASPIPRSAACSSGWPRSRNRCRTTPTMRA